MTALARFYRQREFVFGVLEAAAADPSHLWVTHEFVDEMRLTWDQMEVELLSPPPAKRRRRKPKPPTPLQLAKERHKAVRAARAEEYVKKVFRAYENARLTTRPTREIRDIQSAAYALYDGGFKGWLVATTLGISIAHARTLLSYWRNGRRR